MAMKRKLGTAEIEAPSGLQAAVRHLNEQRPDLLQTDIVHMAIVGEGVYRKLIVVYWCSFE
jgi:hypothetical protein